MYLYKRRYHACSPRSAETILLKHGCDDLNSPAYFSYILGDMQESRPKIVIDFRAEMNIFNDSFDHKLMPTDSRKSFLLALDSLLPN